MTRLGAAAMTLYVTSPQIDIPVNVQSGAIKFDVMSFAWVVVACICILRVIKSHLTLLKS